MASLRDDPAPLTSGNQRVKNARKLARRAFRVERRLFPADGPKAVDGALHTPGCPVEVFATPEATQRYADLVALADEQGIAWTLVDERAMGSLSDAVNPQGVLAVCRFVDRPLDHVLPAVAGGFETGAGASSSTTGESAVAGGFETGAGAPSSTTGEASVVEEVAQQPSRDHARLVAICADVRDPGNAGTVIRTSDAAGADAVVLAGHSVDAHNPKTVRATVGSLFHLPLAVVTDPGQAVRRAQDAGLRVLAADGAGEIDLDDAEDDGLLTGPTAWLFGNEAWGLPEELADLADHRVRIPIHGRAESLNLSTAAAVCLYASARAHRVRPNSPSAGSTWPVGRSRASRSDSR